ncbi:hypothetical protein DM01DRAFT_1336392 [Hesseltinella vesiculosa]|uniref:Uncharacterized protein n=1 Tax=Hesseltinella vesiculosa TaxID=101127 RepID=A0A1X2GGM7_9FUNG|nr:hypothetical protein DM01DRAFT_1336392 [Hesseltinella vesiculosa]
MQGTKHGYAASVSTASTPSRRPPPMKKRREQPHPPSRDNLIYMEALDFRDPFDEDEAYKVESADQLQDLLVRMEELKLINREQQQKLEIYQQQLRFPTTIVKEAVAKAIEDRVIQSTDELNEDLITQLLLSSWMNPKESLSLPFAIRQFRDEWKKQAKNLGSLSKKPSKQALVKSESTPTSSKQHSTPLKDGAIYITAAASTATSSQHSFVAISTTSGSRVRMIASASKVEDDNVIDDDTRRNLFEQFINGTIPSPRTLPSPPETTASPQDSQSHQGESKLTEAEEGAIKETTRKCFMAFDGKMIIESETERMEYLETNCPMIPPASRLSAAEFFKSELEKIRNKTKKQLLRHQNYSTDKWDRPIEEVCLLIVGKHRWERMAKDERYLICGKYAFLRMELENIRDRKAKVKWDKLQDEFERYVKGYKGGWEQLCGYWISKDRQRFDQRKVHDIGIHAENKDSPVNHLPTPSPLQQHPSPPAYPVIPIIPSQPPPPSTTSVNQPLLPPRNTPLIVAQASSSQTDLMNSSYIHSPSNHPASNNTNPMPQGSQMLPAGYLASQPQPPAIDNLLYYDDPIYYLPS